MTDLYFDKRFPRLFPISWYQGHFFNEYNMEGVNEEANEIFLELPPENLVRAMKTAQSAKSVKIKLTKKHSPCLTFEVEQVSWC